MEEEVSAAVVVVEAILLGVGMLLVARSVVPIVVVVVTAVVEGMLRIKSNFWAWRLSWLFSLQGLYDHFAFSVLLV